MAITPDQQQVGENDVRVRAHLAEVSRSDEFSHAPQLRSFLEFLVTETLAGRADELKEANLGRDVFRRGPGYDPRSDAIVRVQASILRKRLAAYYEGAGQQSALRIELPKGAYVPSFQWTRPGLNPAGPSEQTSSTHGGKPATSQRGTMEQTTDQQSASGPTTGNPTKGFGQEANPWKRQSRRWFLGAGASFAAGVGATLGGLEIWDRVARPQRPVLAKTAPGFDARRESPRIWGQLLQPGLPVQLAFGCPQFFNGSGLYIRDVMVNDTSGDSAQRVQELSQMLKSYLTPVPNTYTGVGEMRGIHHITRFLAYEGVDAAFENVQLLTPEAIAGKTLILVASHRFRTLLDLIELPRAIRSSFQEGGGFVMENGDGAQPRTYTTRGSGGASESYGLVSFWTQPSTGGKILLLSGIDSWATYGAAMYITSQPHLKELESKLENSFPQSQAGVQVLLHLEGHNNMLTHVRYETHRLL
ncbi:MAG: hypothetical protein MUF01_12855 [Bryobacterales bacterium]|nr:hypothetical protein [Bryobacterales bacterium]